MLTTEEKKALAEKLGSIEKDLADAKAELEREFEDTEVAPAEKPPEEDEDKEE